MLLRIWIPFAVPHCEQNTFSVHGASCTVRLLAPLGHSPTMNLGVIGLVHDHVNWILNYKSENVKIVGIVEKNINSINRYKKSYNLPDSIFFDSMNDLYNKRKVDAVTAFNSTYDHLKVVKFFAQ